MSFKVELTLEKYKIRIKCNHPDYLQKMKEHFSLHVPNYFWQPKFKAGMWDGKVHFITDANLMPYGLLLDLLKLHKKEYPSLEISADQEVKKLFKGDDITIRYDLKLTPRPYQKESIEVMLSKTKGIIRSATASGKSLVIAYIIKNLLDNRDITKVRRALIIVPSTSLVEQFKGDMIEYGIPEQFIGKVYTGFKEWDRSIVMSTWQTLQNNHDKLSMYDCVIGDECHQVKAHELKKIFSKCHAKYRLGFTGTLPSHPVDLMNTKAFLGPILKEFPSGLLAEQGYIAKCNVILHEILYPLGIQSERYIDIKQEVFKDDRRLKLLEKIVEDTPKNILILVSYINEGEMLEKMLNRRSKREVMFLSGRDKTDIREEWRQKMINQNNIALIATYGIFQQGINIPNLKDAILASPTKSKIRTLQSVGRTLRAFDNEEATIHDIIDDVRFLYKHGKKRIEYYKSEGFNLSQVSRPINPY